MRIVCGEGGELPELIEADEFRQFAVVVSGPPDAARLARAAGPLGRADGNTHVFVDPEALRRLRGARPADERWSAALDAMLAFARSRGWSDDAGMIRAHVEWLD